MRGFDQPAAGVRGGSGPGRSSRSGALGPGRPSPRPGVSPFATTRPVPPLSEAAGYPGEAVATQPVAVVEEAARGHPDRRERPEPAAAISRMIGIW